jgi:GDPmannose 4,6-dehydratase
VLQVLSKVQPHEIYNLAGQSSVGLSFEQPVETMESIALGTLNLLEGIRFMGSGARFYSAGSSECFGNTRGAAANENTPFEPRSPYAVAKAAAKWETSNYREAYGLYACTGILFNHESPLRPERFVTTKVISAASRIAAGGREKLRLGNLDIVRDWGWGPEYVNAIWLMLQQEAASDFVIGTGKSYSLREFVATAFEEYGLCWEDHVVVESSLYRPTEILESRADPAKAREVLGWEASCFMPELVSRLVRSRKEMTAGTSRASRTHLAA